MHVKIQSALAALLAAVAAQAGAQITLYEHGNFGGCAFTTTDALNDFSRIGFNDQASSIVVAGRPWEVCEDSGFRGRCLLLRPGYYPSLRETGLENRISSAREWRGEHHEPDERYGPPPRPPQVTFFEHPGFGGRAIAIAGDAPDFRALGFNNLASSVIVLGQPWEACERADYGGRCVVLRPGRYPDLGSMGLQDRLSSVRLLAPGLHADEGRYAPPPLPAYDWRRRPQERLYEVPVLAVRAVYAAPQQRCWIERERVLGGQPRPDPGGALVGAVIGGILGHQVGGGSGRDVATIGGAVAGAAIGGRLAGRERETTSIQDVQRCAAVPPQGRPDYWDVTYNFRGVEHHLQAAAPPGPTITVNEAGEPRQ